MSFLPAAIAAPAVGALRLLPTLVLQWLARFFGRTLRAGEYFPNLIGQARNTPRVWQPSRDA